MKRRSPLLAVLLAGTLLAAACSSDSDSSSNKTTTTSKDASGTTVVGGEGVEGCDEGSATDPSDLSADRPVARCEAGAPAAIPLPEMTKVNITSTSRAETSAWLYLALYEGEFEAENLDVNLVDLKFSEAIPQIATGAVQAASGGSEAGWFNGVGQDIPVKWVFGNFFPPNAGDIDVPQTGLWVNKQVFSDPDNPDFTELKGKSLGSAIGPGSIIMYPMDVALDDLGVDLASMDIRQLPAADVVTALRNGSVDAAWLLDPTWSQVSDDDDFILAATQTPGEPLGGLYFGEQLLTTDRDTGLAIMRAIVRTVNTYLAGDYEADPELAQKLADALDTTVDAVAGGDSESLIFDWEIREGTTDRAQKVFEKFEVLNQDPLPEDEVVDRSLYLEVVGQG